MMKSMLYPGVFNMKIEKDSDQVKDLMCVPLYFPRLAGEEENYKDWRNIKEVYHISHYIEPQPLACKVKVENTKLHVYPLHQLAFASSQTEYSNAFVVYKRKSGKLIVFGTMNQYEETMITINGVLRILWEDIPLLSVDYSV